MSYGGDKQIGSGPRVPGKDDLTYDTYLKVPEITALQTPASDPAHHDEMLFIVIHQAFELWFKLVLHELENARALLEKKDILQAHHFIKRVVEIQKLFIAQIHILETMTPADFMQFRDRLNPASGFQSAQFREVEFLLGLKEERYLQFFANQPKAKARLEKRLKEKDINAAYFELLAALGYKTGKQNETALEVLKEIYQTPAKNLPLYLLTEALVDLDQSLSLWRQHHVQVVERLIGAKTGTGGSSGVEYLKKTTTKRCFPLLWEARTLIEK